MRGANHGCCRDSPLRRKAHSTEAQSSGAVVSPRNDGHWIPRRQIEVVTLTKDGKRLTQESSGLAPDQKLYHGFVKPYKTEHDTQSISPTRRKRIGKEGGGNLRVELDFEIKSSVQKAIRAARKAHPARDMTDIKREVAEQNQLPFVRNKIEIPDARIHYDMDQPVS